jgi:hypothetical protein
LGEIESFEIEMWKEDEGEKTEESRVFVVYIPLD